MLKYSYSINSSSDTEEVNLNDLYISPDLSFVSGTSENINTFPIGSTLWVRSPYFPQDYPINVKSTGIVKRNGYVLVPTKLQVQEARLLIGGNESSATTMYYVEYNGNTYYESTTTGKFTINGVDYSRDGNSYILEIMSPVYIEDNKIIVDGITYNALVNNSGDLSVTDFTGIPFAYEALWDVSNVTSGATIVEKIYIGDNEKNNIECKSVTYYGHMAYVVYDDEKEYINYFYDENGNITGCGVIVDDTEFTCDALYNNHDISHGFNNINIYDINEYSTDDSGQSFMTIYDDQYLIYFEPCDIQGSGLICLETVDNYLSILKYDRITIKSNEYSAELKVRSDND